MARTTLERLYVPTAAVLVAETFTTVAEDVVFSLVSKIPLTLAPRPVPVVPTEHIHVPRTSVREQAGILAGRLRALGRASFRQLTSDCAGTYEVVARFLALLDLYRDGNVSFEQLVPLGDLYVTWAGPETGPLIGAGEEDDWT